MVDFILFDMIYYKFMGRLLSEVLFNSSSSVRVNCRWIDITCLQVIGH